MSHLPPKLKLQLNPLPSPATSVHGSSSHHMAEEMNEPSALPPSRKKAASQHGKPKKSHGRPKKSRKKVASWKTDVLPIITQDGLQAEGAGCATSPPGHPQLCSSTAGTCDSSRLLRMCEIVEDKKAGAKAGAKTRTGMQHRLELQQDAKNGTRVPRPEQPESQQEDKNGT
ncbi:uncharacterized protein EI90DRAFT_3014989 [Cantharellus anzutake]|uniref:uncharacterized protein n=1 Tax=Cantharellus anzutake TaxID=1750568 RepID=UPI0019032755|nr:uncharacterized protein EI90DRAFT_3014989 [Cantharellus anzutake]KAF8334749.1 hypothetical protein EI90DRAFT_3014989 [Cantharellus anzutake]